MTFGPQSPAAVRRQLRARGVLPLVRPTRSDFEVAHLPPRGDPEVHLALEAAVYLLAGVTVLEVLERLTG